MDTAPNLMWMALALTFITTALLSLLIVKYGKSLLSIYNVKVVGHVDSQLKQNFVSTSPTQLLAATALSCILCVAAGFFLFGFFGVVPGLIAGLSTPWIYHWLVKRKRREAFVYQLPDALSSLSTSMKGGGSLSKGLEMLAIRQPSPLCQEFSLLVAENRVGKDVEESLKDMKERLKCPELELLNIAISVSRNVGGNLADTLEILADTLREKAQVEGKIAALTATGKAQGWVISLLPFGVGLALYYQEPEKMSALFNEPWGWLMLAVMSAMMVLAVWLIYKIVNIDV
ncbi:MULTISPECIES: type II secretion system F family protein [Marinobacterium]|uniref:Type II secretion system protein F (GspF) n=1 Tax=Marinobacterium iners DSM 11526 TaxID=1122198 RepID=A0A1H4GES0_9GAMM|nr:type II secretion system F family protein [Marinobacterium iners]SEB07510.1 type II secretion system protein F (GspF) [Marinobacterium iners DSM 11526]